MFEGHQFFLNDGSSGPTAFRSLPLNCASKGRTPISSGDQGCARSNNFSTICPEIPGSRGESLTWHTGYRGPGLTLVAEPTERDWTEANRAAVKEFVDTRSEEHFRIHLDAAAEDNRSVARPTWISRPEQVGKSQPGLYYHIRTW